MARPQDHNSRQDPQQNITALFDRVAPRYDFLNHVLSCGYHRLWRRKLISWIPDADLANQRPQRFLLDVATGTGDVALNASSSLNTYAQIHAVDLSVAMLERARKKAQQKSSSNITFQQADGRDLPFATASFHCVSISFGLRNIQGVDRALREFHRVLKPGGILLILEFFPAPLAWGSWLFRFYFRRILPAVAGLISNSQDYAYLPQSVERFYSVREFKQLACRMGFTLKREHGFLLGSCKLLMLRKENVA